MSFGFITFCGKLPRGAVGYLLKTLFSILSDLTLIHAWNHFKLEVNPCDGGCTFLSRVCSGSI